MASGLNIVSGGTDSHLMLVDLRPKGVTGKAAEAALERANITCNKNGIPFDPAPPAITSGVRLGTPAGTTRGFGQAEFRRIGQLIAEVRRRPGGQWRGGQRRGRGQGARRGAGLDGAVPDLHLIGLVARRRGLDHALPVLRRTRKPGEGQPPVGRRRDHPAPARCARSAAAASPPSSGCSCAS